MKHILSAVALSTLLFACGSQKNGTSDLANSNPIKTSIDLTQVVDDKAPVTINPGRFTQDTIVYRLPRIIQGSYAVNDFGKYIEAFKALDYDGNEITSTKLDDNTWQILNASRLDKIEYYVNDTFDLEVKGGIGEDVPFSPGGTNISPDNYVLNLHGFIGYFDSLKNAQYAIDVTSPANFERTSALENTAIKSSDDGTKITTSYFAPRYFDVTDNPMMYGKLDVEEFMVGDIKIVLSVYSPNKVYSASSLKETVYKMMEAQKRYLGDINSTPRYDVYLYLSDGSQGSPKGFGALEHHTSTVVVLSESASAESLAKSVTDVVAHEFFHIVTPLSVHSEDVHYFDYNDPTFSKHLWMYEGVTEYFAQHFQVYEGLVTPEEYYNEINTQIRRSLYYDDNMSFTEMSENILEDPYKPNYANVYQKGALIGMCIDILLREESNGNRSMLSLMKELSNKYGKHKPFDDESIIDEIVGMTYPSIGGFLNTHVIGSTPIDYSVFLDKVGLIFKEESVETGYIQSGSGFIFAADPEKETLFFSESVKENSFWNENGVKANDIVKRVNGTDVSMQNARAILGQMYQWKPGQEVEVVLDRNGKEVILKKELTPTFTAIKTISENENATASQIATRKAWLKLKSDS
ncbi:peptidase M61 [uncultured Psychroserpens sp.]|uniref:M61 family metallopeptidase n=1 Tax=uncultured Psychroserpens sp. TaxID=255436 RepID=UPI00261D4346|nr:peptidase M61 [uncultured Psychroserpens sp.]